jgi:hypothetical protein
MKVSISYAVSTLALGILLMTPRTAASQENIGTSCADCPNLQGEFSIENETGVTIHYQVRWGTNHAWKSMTLETGHVMTHSHPLDDNGRAPSPWIRFDGIGGDNAFTPKEYHVAFHAVGYAGYGPAENKATPKRYAFEYAADHRTLNLVAR